LNTLKLKNSQIVCEVLAVMVVQEDKCVRYKEAIIHKLLLL
jgi:hypothetical protein